MFPKTMELISFGQFLTNQFSWTELKNPDASFNASSSSLAMTGYLDTPPSPLPPTRLCRESLPKINFSQRRKAEKQRHKPETRSHNIVIQDADGMYRCKEAGCAYVTSTNHAFREHRSVRHTNPEKRCPILKAKVESNSTC